MNTLENEYAAKYADSKKIPSGKLIAKVQYIYKRNVRNTMIPAAAIPNKPPPNLTAFVTYECNSRLPVSLGPNK